MQMCSLCDSYIQHDSKLYATFYKHGTIIGSRPVFDKMFDSRKRLECFPNDVWISPEKVGKCNLNYLIRKIDKIGSADWASDSGRCRSALTHESIQVVMHLQPRRPTNSGFCLRQTLLQAVMIYARCT